MYLYYIFIAETVRNANPYIYDKKNFDIKISNPMNSVHIPIKTFGNVQLEILAKSASFGQGNILHINTQYFIQY